MMFEAFMKASNKPLNEAKYKRNKFEAKPVGVGDVYFDSDNAKPGYYNYRKVTDIKGDVATVIIWDPHPGSSRGHQHTVKLSDIQRMMDKSAVEIHDKKESVNELAHGIGVDIGINKVKGGDLKLPKVQAELTSSIGKLKATADRFKVESDTVPAGGFSGANSGTMRSHRSGNPITVSFNNVHRGGYYSMSTPYIVQIQVGGALPSQYQNALLIVAKDLLSKYSYTTELGTSRVTTTDGTNWSSAMLTAPSKGDTYSIIKALNL